MYNIIKSLFEKEKTFSNKHKTIYFFSLNDNFKNIPRPNWEIQMDWENDIEHHKIRPG